RTNRRDKRRREPPAEKRQREERRGDKQLRTRRTRVEQDRPLDRKRFTTRDLRSTECRQQVCSAVVSYRVGQHVLCVARATQLAERGAVVRNLEMQVAVLPANRLLTRRQPERNSDGYQRLQAPPCSAARSIYVVDQFPIVGSRPYGAVVRQELAGRLERNPVLEKEPARALTDDCAKRLAVARWWQVGESLYLHAARTDCGNDTTPNPPRPWTLGQKVGDDLPP